MPKNKAETNKQEEREADKHADKHAKVDVQCNSGGFEGFDDADGLSVTDDSADGKLTIKVYGGVVTWRGHCVGVWLLFEFWVFVSVSVVLVFGHGLRRGNEMVSSHP